MTVCAVCRVPRQMDGPLLTRGSRRAPRPWRSDRGRKTRHMTGNYHRNGNNWGSLSFHTVVQTGLCGYRRDAARPRIEPQRASRRICRVSPKAPSIGDCIFSGEKPLYYTQLGFESTESERYPISARVIHTRRGDCSCHHDIPI